METLMHEASNQQLSISSLVNKSCELTQSIQKNKIINIGSKKKDNEVTEIVFENLHYTVSAGFNKGKKEILHGINGRLIPSQLVAIMGPSGAGKSTLLDILSGYRLTDVKGSFYINGKPRDLNVFRRTSAYITQDDRLQPLLTVMENMEIAADLKLGTDVSWNEKHKIITDILMTLGLDEHIKTRTSRLSGGQQKRLSIALELVNNPTVMFLDEPTTGLDSSTCTQVVSLLKVLAKQGKTIICTIHQPSASLFQQFDQVYILSKGYCLYQGATDELVKFLDSIKLPCPMYHNPADYIIELACGEYGDDKIDVLIQSTNNGKNLSYFKNSHELIDDINSGKRYLEITNNDSNNTTLNKNKSLQATSPIHQLKVLLYRGYIKCKRDSAHTHLRLGVNVLTGIMLGSLFINAGNDGKRVRENYNLLFGILMHHMMTSMMLTILTFPTEMSILTKEHFNRWYSLKMFYTSVTLIDIPVSIVSCFLFTIIIYFMSGQPADLTRFTMFFVISLLIVFVAQGIGLLIGSVFNVINGTFVGPTISVPMMMFAGFGVTLKDMPHYLKWGTYVSYLRYGLEGYIHAIYGLNRPNLNCEDSDDGGYCRYKTPQTFLDEITMTADQFWNDIIGLIVILIIVRVAAYYFLRWKLMASR
ncbi:hypothetical protein HCN44_001248 [Aphidius gifuensis]|uniref:ABC transporter domain-containing protein n=1 Tax=Aphidius gifuensis TaxID=684658 RepID=A0A834XNX3_APHGI|nr:ATP-binding cassette sub-family G member 1 [Aphidius gifuensis]XP_044014845.1 ATP-binding cassette sub-family G member 1 [Aphidius gifuensis]XP_044014846.1 ATP-binding cassette sub-family G member 1 [Aphidius gifuensis]KAF7988675.1 hypothetical protein HCN44_001248 [Aphidius gifuensis]